MLFCVLDFVASTFSALEALDAQVAERQRLKEEQQRQEPFRPCFRKLHGGGSKPFGDLFLRWLPTCCLRFSRVFEMFIELHNKFSETTYPFLNFSFKQNVL